MNRKIASTLVSLEAFAILPTSDGIAIDSGGSNQEAQQWQGDIITWLQAQGSAQGASRLLAHADDGVIWGEWRADGLHLSSQAYDRPGLTAKLHAKTLLQARVFGPMAELFLWRTEGGWRGRWVRDGQGKPCDYLDEPQLLWGTTREDYQDGFVLMAEGAEGLRHAPPMAEDELPKQGRFRFQLHVRHYLRDDEDNQAYIAFSRLTNLSAQS